LAVPIARLAKEIPKSEHEIRAARDQFRNSTSRWTSNATQIIISQSAKFICNATTIALLRFCFGDLSTRLNGKSSNERFRLIKDCAPQRIEAAIAGAQLRHGSDMRANSRVLSIRPLAIEGLINSVRLAQAFARLLTQPLGSISSNGRSARATPVGTPQDISDRAESCGNGSSAANRYQRKTGSGFAALRLQSNGTHWLEKYAARLQRETGEAHEAPRRLLNGSEGLEMSVRRSDPACPRALKRRLGYFTATRPTKPGSQWQFGRNILSTAGFFVVALET
jgi:hypothetical protein